MGAGGCSEGRSSRDPHYCRPWSHPTDPHAGDDDTKHPCTDAASLASLRAGDEIELPCDHSGGVVRIVNIRI
jgi:hypothetical protein